eukprot:gene18376-biopygen11454
MAVGDTHAGCTRLEQTPGADTGFPGPGRDYLEDHRDWGSWRWRGGTAAAAATGNGVPSGTGNLAPEAVLSRDMDTTSRWKRALKGVWAVFSFEGPIFPRRASCAVFFLCSPKHRKSRRACAKR